MEWSKKEFPNNRKEIDRIEQELNDLRGMEEAEEIDAREEELIKELGEIWSKEEMYWYQRSRVN